MPSIGRTLRLPALLVLLQLAAVDAPARETMPPRAAPELLGLGHSGQILSLAAMPGDTVVVPLNRGPGSEDHVVLRWLPGPGTDGPVVETAVGPDLRAIVPSVPGVYSPEIIAGTVTYAFDWFHLLIRVPAEESRRGVLRGYRIGQYPTGAPGRYSPPEGFIEVRPEDTTLRISRSFSLRDFFTHDQADVWPKFVLVDYRLIDKLELLIDELNRTGVRATGLTVMSGFRTPQYNALGLDQGRASLSRHQYGDAADVWVDTDHDGIMDDLNGDGRNDRADAAFLLRIAERIEARHPDLVGGMSAYTATSAHGPFLHVDARGTRARW